MVITLPIRALIVTALVVFVSSLPLAAQTAETGGGGAQEGAPPQTEGEGNDRGSTRPFRGLFGLDDSGRTARRSPARYSARTTTTSPQRFPGGRLIRAITRSGWYTGANSQLSFNWRGERTSANGWAERRDELLP